jgi:ABC-type branched-subunit amino acid transport system ATPase component
LSLGRRPRFADGRAGVGLTPARSTSSATGATHRDEFTLTILLVEHHMSMVMRVSDKVVAMDFGRKIAEGLPAEVRQDRR